MHVHTQYLEDGVVYNVQIDDYFLFLRYKNMASFLYFWMAFYSMFLCRKRDASLLLNGSYIFMITFVWQNFWELVSLLKIAYPGIPLIPSTYHDLGDELIGQSLMTLLGILLFVLLDKGVGDIPVFESKKWYMYEIQLFAWSFSMYVISFLTSGMYQSWNIEAVIQALWSVLVIGFLWMVNKRDAFPEYDRTYALLAWTSFTGWMMVIVFYTWSFWVFLISIASMALVILYKTRDRMNKSKKTQRMGWTWESVTGLFSLTVPIFLGSGLALDYIYPYGSYGKMWLLLAALCSAVVSLMPLLAGRDSDGRKWISPMIYSAGIMFIWWARCMFNVPAYSQVHNADKTDLIVTLIDARINKGGYFVIYIIGIVMIGVSAVFRFNYNRANGKGMFRVIASIFSLVVLGVGIWGTYLYTACYESVHNYLWGAFMIFASWTVWQLVTGSYLIYKFSENITRSNAEGYVGLGTAAKTRY